MYSTGSVTPRSAVIVFESSFPRFYFNLERFACFFLGYSLPVSCKCPTLRCFLRSSYMKDVWHVWIMNDLHGMQSERPQSTKGKRNELRDRNLILKGETPSLNNHRNRRNRFRPSDRTLYELGCYFRISFRVRTQSKFILFGWSQSSSRQLTESKPTVKSDECRSWAGKVEINQLG